MKRKTSLLTLVVLFAMMLLAVSTANVSAKTPPDSEVTILTMEELEKLRQQFALSDPVSYGGTSYHGMSYKVGMGVNEWGCYGQTMNPHATWREGIRVVSVHAKSQCKNKVDRLWVSTQLYREYNCWFGYCLDRQTWGPPGQRGRDNAWKVEVWSAGPCWNNEQYYAFSAHSMIGPDDKQYTAFTWKRNRVTDC